jgi:hypothetical protein
MSFTDRPTEGIAFPDQQVRVTQGKHKQEHCGKFEILDFAISI